jgi:rare lipoprotein A
VKYLLKILLTSFFIPLFACSYKASPVLLTPHSEIGQASYYGSSISNLEALTASGEKFDPTAYTAAHKTLPFGTKVKIENLENNKTVVVRINDRGPFVEGRIVDVSYAAASELGMLNSGKVPVRLSCVK